MAASRSVVDITLHVDLRAIVTAAITIVTSLYVYYRTRK